jgi:hypothetical protein
MSPPASKAITAVMRLVACVLPCTEDPADPRPLICGEITAGLGQSFSEHRSAAGDIIERHTHRVLHEARNALGTFPDDGVDIWARAINPLRTCTRSILDREGPVHEQRILPPPRGVIDPSGPAWVAAGFRCATRTRPTTETMRSDPSAGSRELREAAGKAPDFGTSRLDGGLVVREG